MLYHVGPPIHQIKNSKLSPDFFAKNPYTRREASIWNKPRVFFYTKLSDKEWRVKGTVYRIKYPLDRLYAFNKDPLKFYRQCFDGSIHPTVPQQLSCISDKAESFGFDGMISRWMDTYRADIWVDVPVDERMVIDLAS